MQNKQTINKTRFVPKNKNECLWNQELYIAILFQINYSIRTIQNTPTIDFLPRLLHLRFPNHHNKLTPKIVVNKNDEFSLNIVKADMASMNIVATPWK